MKALNMYNFHSVQSVISYYYLKIRLIDKGLTSTHLLRSPSLHSMSTALPSSRQLILFNTDTRAFVVCLSNFSEGPL